MHPCLSAYPKNSEMISYPNVKINLGLHVLRKRPDGFHDLETLFVACDAFHDTLEITESSLELPEGQVDIQIENCDWDPQKDLTAQAWRLLKADFPELPPVRIRMVKGSPVGAGLGGGSADCAFALRMMNGLFSLGLSDENLASYAARLGSDCAFFVYNTQMFASGRGEVLSPFELDLTPYEIKLAIPDGIHVSTREAYGGIVPCDERPSLQEILQMPVERWKDNLVNDFEKTVFAVHPGIAELKEEMYRQGAVYAAMSGSGSAVFGLFRKQI